MYDCDLPLRPPPPAPNHRAYRYRNSSTHKQPSQKQSIVSEFRKAIQSMESLNTPIYIDIQWLNSSNKGIIIKDFTADCAGAPPAWIIVKSPPGDIPSNAFTVRHVHGIEWDDDVTNEVSLRDCVSNLFNKDRPVFVKNQQKMNILINKLWIPRQLVTPLEDAPRLSDLCIFYNPPSCPYHRHLNKTMACTSKHIHAMMSYQKEWKIN